MKTTILTSLLLLSTFALTGCFSIRTDSTFVFNGTVVSPNGGAVVLQPTDGYAICVEVSYTTTKEGVTTDVSETVDCTSLVTDQTGRFAISRQVRLQGTGDLITINNAKVYARKKKSDSLYYMIPASVESIQLSPQGGKITAKIVAL